MTDKLTPDRRSANMARIRSKNTSPEMTIRRIVYEMGFRYRLHVAHLPGKPDLVFTRLKKIIDVRGCFWHQHGPCSDSRFPQSRQDYWRPKLQRNRRRDKKNLGLLEALGWKVLVLWECEVADVTRLRRSLSKFLH